MRDAGDQPKTFMSSAPTLPATVAIAASAEIPPRPPVLGLLKGADADILHGQPLAVILELGDHDVVEALVRARDLGLEPGKLGLHFPDLADKLHVVVHRPASTPLIHRSRFPASPAGRCTHSPGSVTVSPR